MSTFETSDQPVARSWLQGLFAAYIQRLMDYRRHQARRKVLIHLSHYDAHRLRDMGIDPQDVEDALNDRRRSLLLHPIRPTGVR